jgi:hypothetical protein
MNCCNKVTVINYDQKFICSLIETRFLVLTVDNAVCFVLQNIKYVVLFVTVSLIYFAHVQSIMSYGIIFWGNSSFAKKVFILQKKIIIRTNTKPRHSCREIFKKLEIIMLYSLLLYIINKNVFNFKNEPHKYLIRFHNNLHIPPVNTTKLKKAHMSGIKVFSHIPQSIENLAIDEKSFKFALKKFLCRHSFYSIEECIQHREDRGL